MTTSERKTEVLYGAYNALQRGVYFMSNVRRKMDIYFDKTAPSIVIDIDEYNKGYKDIKRSGGKIRLLTEITSENISYCKQLINLVDELRHIDGIKGGLAISETEFMATTILEEATPLTQVIYSNVKELVEQGQYIFDTLWSNSATIPAKQRIKEIERGVVREVIETIRDPFEIQKRAFELLRFASDEILMIVPTTKSFYTQEKIGLTDLLTEAARERGVRIRLLVGREAEDTGLEIEKSKRNWETMDIHTLQSSLQTKLLVIVVDKAFSLAIELKDAVEDLDDDTTGIATYSNSESTVLTYSSIFENLWIQEEVRRKKRGENTSPT